MLTYALGILDGGIDIKYYCDDTKRFPHTRERAKEAIKCCSNNTNEGLNRTIKHDKQTTNIKPTLEISKIWEGPSHISGITSKALTPWNTKCWMNHIKCLESCRIQWKSWSYEFRMVTIVKVYAQDYWQYARIKSLLIVDKFLKWNLTKVLFKRL